MFFKVNRFVYSCLFRFECFLINKGIRGLRSLWPFLTKEGGVFSCSRLFVVEILLAIQLAFNHGCGRASSTLLVMILDASNAPWVGLPWQEIFPVLLYLWVLTEEEFRLVRLVSNILFLFLRQILIHIVKSLVPLDKAHAFSDTSLQLGQSELAIAHL